MPALQSRRWTWTLNNYTEEEETAIKSLTEEKGVTYLLYGQELAPQSGTPHLQGYVEFSTKRALGGVKLLISQRIHAERASQSALVNIRYCKKTRPGDTPNTVVHEYGQPRQQNLHGNDGMDRLNEMLRDGSDLKEIAEENPSLYCRLHRGIDRFIQVTGSRTRKWATKLILYTGPTRCGKSYRAHHFDDATWKYPGINWFDGYFNDDVVLFDDYRGGKDEVPLGKLFEITDAYPCQVRTKGGHVSWSPRTVIMTSNVSPDAWYPGKDMSPFWARVALWVHWTEVSPRKWDMHVRIGEMEEGPYKDPYRD